MGSEDELGELGGDQWRWAEEDLAADLGRRREGMREGENRERGGRRKSRAWGVGTDEKASAEGIGRFIHSFNLFYKKKILKSL